MDARCQRTNAVSEGVTPTLSLVDPRPIDVITSIMGKVFPGISDSGQRVRMEDEITQQGTRVARIEDRGECGAWRKTLHQPIVKCLEGRFSVSAL